MKNFKNFLTLANAVVLTKSGHKTLASGLATSRPLGERGEPCLAAKRPTASDEVGGVDLSRLMGFPFHFAPKMGSGVTRIWGFRFHEIRRRTFLKV